MAKEQAGIQQDEEFRITDFNYNVDVVSNLMKEHLNNITFNGLSVSNLNINMFINNHHKFFL